MTTPDTDADAAHNYELPAGIDAFRCVCRRTWLRMLDPERVVDLRGSVNHAGTGGWFYCCDRRFRWSDGGPSTE